MKVLIIILVVLCILLIAFLSNLIYFRNKTNNMKLGIKQQMSDARITKSEYVKTLQMIAKANEAVNSSTSQFYSPSAGINFLGKGSAAYETLTSTVTQLARKYSDEQRELNNLITKYNKEISKLINIPFAKILHRKPISLIDEKNLKASLGLKNDIDNEI